MAVLRYPGHGEVWSCVGRWFALKGLRRGGSLQRMAHPSSFLVAVSQGDADASGLWEFGTCACLHTPCSWFAHEGEILRCLERERNHRGERGKGEDRTYAVRGTIGRHKARNPWEYRACASLDPLVCCTSYGVAAHPSFFLLFPPLFFRIWDSVTWRIWGFLNHVAA